MNSGNCIPMEEDMGAVQVAFSSFISSKDSLLGPSEMFDLDSTLSTYISSEYFAASSQYSPMRDELSALLE